MAETTFHSITLPGANPARVPLTAVEFSTSTAYKVRDYCTYQGKLYICSTAHAAGAWNAAHFTEVNVCDEINTRLVVPPTTEPASTDRRVGDLWIDTNTESPVISIDPQPAAGSTNVPQSGGTFNLIKNLDNNKAGKSLLTGDFSATSPYSVNDLCIHDGYLYRCIVDIPTGAAWNASKWQATTIETELARIESEGVDLDVIAETFGDSSSYAVGDYVLYTTNGVDKLYKCTSAVSDTSVWNSQYWSEIKLADEVSDLKSALNVFENSVFNGSDKIISKVLEMFPGAIHGQSYGNHVSMLDTAYNLTKITAEDFQTLTFNNAIYKVSFVGYANDGTYQAVGSWITTSPVDLSNITVQGNFWCVQFRRQDGANLTSSDFTLINASLNHIKENNLVYKSDLIPIEEQMNNTTVFTDFKPEGVYKTITNWKFGQIRSAFPDWTDSTTKTIMTTEDPFEIKEGTAIILNPGYSFILIRSTGAATRYNSSIVVNFDDTIWIEVNRTDGQTISTSETPITLVVKWAINASAYVDGVNGLDTNDGSISAPYKTIMQAVRTGAEQIYVKAGTYHEMVNLGNLNHSMSISLWEMPTFDGAVAEVPKIVIDGNGTQLYGVLSEANIDLSLSDVHCKNTAYAPFYLKNCKYVYCVRCIASDTTGNTVGFQINNANGEFINCVAYNTGKDGFNIHGYGNTEFVNCIAHDCGDDGISHHDGCTGSIIGGEYYNCVKGGVASPTYGAYIDVSGVYSHDNTFGIYSVSEDMTRRITEMKISNCVLKNNSNVDLFLRRANAVMWNTIYDTKTIDADSTLVEIT